MERQRVASVVGCALVWSVAIGCAAPEMEGQGGDPGRAGVQALSRDLTLGSTGPDVEAVFQYFRTFGYFPNEQYQTLSPAWRPIVATLPARPDVFDAQMQRATLAFQKYAGVAQTGVVDQPTREALKQPRCGMVDGHTQPPDPTDKWKLESSGTWGTNFAALKYRVALPGPINGITPDQVKGLTALALAIWAGASGYSFSEATGSQHADITIKSRFEPDTSILGCTEVASDTPPAVCPRVTPMITPSVGIDIFLSTNQPYSTATPATFPDLLAILIHEAGHALGLAHSENLDAVMAQGMSQSNMPPPKRQLIADDRTAIVAMMPGWSAFDNAGGIDMAVNASNGTVVWVIRGQPGQSQTIVDTDGIFVHAHGVPAGHSPQHIGVGPSNAPWISTLGPAPSIFHYNTGTGGWDPVGGAAGCASDIAVGTDESVWIIGCDLVPGGSSILKFTGTLPCSSNCFTKTNDNGAALRISVGPHDHFMGSPIVPWVVNSAGGLFRRTTSTTSSGAWELLMGANTVVDVAADSGLAWVIAPPQAPGGHVIQAFQDGVENLDGQPRLITVFGGALGVAMGGGVPFVVNNGGAVFWTF